MSYITDLKASDHVGISFWLISLALTATTAFFILEQRNVIPKWQLPLNTLYLYLIRYFKVEIESPNS